MIGAYLNGGEPNDLTEKTAGKDGRPPVLHNTFILFNNVSNFKLTGLKLFNPRCWGMTFYYCSDGIISGIEFKAANNVPNQDGIDLRRGCHDITIDNIYGSTGDDSIALTALMGRSETPFSIEDASPDVYNVSISNVSTEVTGGHGIIRLLCHDGIKMHSVSISNIYDRLIDSGLTKCQAAIRLGDERYWTVKPAETGVMSDIHIDGVTTNAPVPVKIYGVIPDCTMENIRQK